MARKSRASCNRCVMGFDVAIEIVARLSLGRSDPKGHPWHVDRKQQDVSSAGLGRNLAPGPVEPDRRTAPDFVRHDPGRELHGTDQNRQFISSIRTAFPDLHYAVDDQIAEGDKVVVRYRFRGTHLGEFQGMPPTRKPVSYSGILIYRVADGKIAEQWTEIDLLGFLRQLGVLPNS
jgi:steroid delta-isomerase-like uncharacterized protein